MTQSRILVIDDDPNVAATISRLCERAGFVVSTSQSGRDGMEMLRHGGIGIVITDIYMPDMDGLEIIRAIRREFGENICIIAMSGGIQAVASDADILSMSRKLGADILLRKPFLRDHLMQAIADVKEVHNLRRKRVIGSGGR